MVAHVRYPGKTVWVNYTINSFALRGADEIRIRDGHVATVWGLGGNDTIWGSASADDIDGGDGADNLFGGAGNDSIRGVSGADYIDGGAGNDHIDGGNDGDSIFGGSGIDTIYGGDGNDILNGGDGGDQLYGGAGNDLFVFNTDMTGWDIARDSRGDDIYRFEGIGRAEIYDAVEVGNDLWVADAATIAAFVATGATFSAAHFVRGAWIHDHATTGRVESVTTTDGTFSIDTLLI